VIAPAAKLGAAIALAALAAAAGYGVWTSTRPRFASTQATTSSAPAIMPARRSTSMLKGTSNSPSARCPIRFEETGKLLGLDFEHQRGDNGDHWLPETMGGGAAWFDLDGDGWQDLYMVQGKRATFGRDVVFRNEHGKGFTRLPEEVVPADPEYGQGVAAGDYNNDGFDDLYVTNFTHHRLYRNNGDGTLTDATASAGLGDGSKEWGTSVAFGDLDGDGNLDLVVCNYARYVHLKCTDPATGKRQYCGPDSYAGRPVVLLRNLGDGRFRDDSQETKIGEPLGKCLGVVVARLLEVQGGPQVFIANDLQPNFLFVPTAGDKLRYRDAAAELRVDRNGEGVRQANMGVAIGDYDRDGRLDLFSTHYYHEHDTLWRNLGPPGFRDVTKMARLYVPTLPQLSWGTQFLDADGDGWLDLFVTSGHINNDPQGAAPYRMPAQFFWNRGSEGEASFDDVGIDLGTYFQVGRIGRGSAVCDFDRDGRPDLVVVHHHERSALLHNRSQSGKAFGMEFIGRRAPRDGHGVRVNVTGPGITKPLMREIHGGGSYLSADARSLLIGVGDASGPFNVDISWPTGSVDHIEGLRAGAWMTFGEGRTTPFAIHPFGQQSGDGGSP